LNTDSSMFLGLVRLRDLGFSPTGILDVGAYEGHFSRGVRQVFKAARILMIDALCEKAPVLADVCREVGNAEHLITVLGDKELGATQFFVVNTEMRPDLVKTGSSKYQENADFPMEVRELPQRTLGSILANQCLPFQLLKLDVQGAELDVLGGLGYQLSKVEVILMEMSLVDYNKGAPLIGVVLRELSDMGFVLYDIIEEHRDRCGRLLQIDGLFLRPYLPISSAPAVLGLKRLINTGLKLLDGEGIGFVRTPAVSVT
jgi:FkbM family methyltransferase